MHFGDSACDRDESQNIDRPAAVAVAGGLGGDRLNLGEGAEYHLETD